MTLEHPAITVYPNEIKEIFQLCCSSKEAQSLDFWIQLVEKHANIIASKQEDPIDKIKYSNEFRGDLLEVLSEIFFKNASYDDRYGLKEYTIADSSNDYGVDATGINIKGKKCAVQCKYRANPIPTGDDILKYEDLTKTFFDGIVNHSCDLLEPNTTFLFTTASTYSVVIDKTFNDKLVFIGRNQLNKILKGNQNFWSLAYESILQITED